MGEVVLAHDDRLDRLVAIKRLHMDHSATPGRRERFRREARIAARLNHPAIVQIHDVLHEGDLDYLIMEYIDGRTLREHCAAGSMAVSEVLGIAHQIALGMAAAHDLGVIHRDLKAENVLITSTGLAKITDFGIAKLHGDDTLTAEGAVIGTMAMLAASVDPFVALEPVGCRYQRTRASTATIIGEGSFTLALDESRATSTTCASRVPTRPSRKLSSKPATQRSAS